MDLTSLSIGERLAKQKRGNERKTPYHVRRWRLAQDSSHTELSDLNHRRNFTNHRLSTQTSRNHQSSNWTITRSSLACQPHLIPSPRADFLLSLVQFNVYRGLYDNKLTISHSVNSILPGHSPVAFDVTFPGVFQIVAKTETPSSLALTKLQTDTIHAPWIDLIPFRKMRDVLIQQQGRYDHIALLLDLLGDVPHLETLSSSDSFPSPRGIPENGRYSLDSIDGDSGNGPSRSGFIIWGDPSDEQNWEITPGFMRKWPWLMKGSEYLLRSTNKWRDIRDEEPIEQIMAADYNH